MNIQAVTVSLLFQAFINHPEVASTKHNRDFVMKQISDAVKAISGVAQSVGDSDPSPFEEAGALAKALSALLVCNYCRIFNILLIIQLNCVVANSLHFSL